MTHCPCALQLCWVLFDLNRKALDNAALFINTHWAFRKYSQFGVMSPKGIPGIEVLTAAQGNSFIVCYKLFIMVTKTQNKTKCANKG